MGRNALPLLSRGARILTHCNAGALATGGYGTALGVVRAAFAADPSVRVVVDETRPLLQGARLTAWELEREGIPYTLIADAMAATMMASGRVTHVVVGADRIAANGDVVNKIGTYGAGRPGARARHPGHRRGAHDDARPVDAHRGRAWSSRSGPPTRCAAWTSSAGRRRPRGRPWPTRPSTSRPPVWSRRS